MVVVIATAAMPLAVPLAVPLAASNIALLNDNAKLVGVVLSITVFAPPTTSTSASRCTRATAPAATLAVPWRRLIRLRWRCYQPCYPLSVYLLQIMKMAASNS